MFPGYWEDGYDLVVTAVQAAAFTFVEWEHNTLSPVQPDDFHIYAVM